MKSSRQGCRGAARWLIPASAGLLLPIVEAYAQRPQVPVATPAPPFSQPVERVPRGQILEYARGLVFDTSVAASDAQYVTLRRDDRTVVGPFMQIAPERGAGSLSDAQLVSGRIIARVSVSDSYPPLGLLRGVSYLWADSAPSGWRWVIVPENPAARLLTLPLTRTRHPAAGADSCLGRSARAVMVAYPSAEGAAGVVVPWTRCPCYGCCCYGGACRESTINPTGAPVSPPREWPRPVPIGGP